MGHAYPPANFSIFYPGGTGARRVSPAKTLKGLDGRLG